MKFLVTTALTAGVALVATGAYAQEDKQRSDSVTEQGATQRDLVDPDAIEEHEESAVEQDVNIGNEGQRQEEMRGSTTPGNEGVDESGQQPMEQPMPETERQQVPVQENQPPSGAVEEDTEIYSSPTYVVVPPATEEQKKEKKKNKGPGVALTAGGGVQGFTDGDVNDVANVGGAYTARLGIGTRSPIGLEVAYEGSAQDIDTVGLDNDAVLLSNGIEGDLRFAFTRSMFQPYVYGGAAWRHYNITNDDFNTSAIADNDDVFEIPVGAGLAYRYQALILDARGSYRFAFDQDLFPGDNADLNNWQATLRAGVEF